MTTEEQTQTQIRIRTSNEAKIIQLNIPKDKLEKLKKIMESKVAESNKKASIRSLTGGSPCCMCIGIPSLELRYDMSDERGKAVVVERYCDSCVKKLYEREQVLKF